MSTVAAPMPSTRWKPAAADADRREAMRLRISKALSQADLPSLMAEDGIQVTKSGSGGYMTRCWVHDDRSPSVHLIPPDHTQAGTWRYFCHGCRTTGNSLDYLSTNRGLAFKDSLDVLERRNQTFTPGAAAVRQRPVEAARISMREQTEAVHLVMEALDRVPGASRAGRDYLVGRGATAAGIDLAGGAWRVRQDEWRLVGESLSQHPKAPLLVAAGLMKDRGKGLVPLWFDDTVIGACSRRSGEPAFLWGRRLDLGILPNMKYMNQSTQNGARFVPFNLPALAISAARGEPLRICEGPITALGSQALPDHTRTLGVMRRPGWGDPVHQQGLIVPPPPAQEDLWATLLPDLKRCQVVEVTPDNDPDDKKTVIGEGAQARELLERHRGFFMAEQLVAHLRKHQVPAYVRPMVADPGYTPLDQTQWAPPLGHACKDLAIASCDLRKREEALRLGTVPEDEMLSVA